MEKIASPELSLASELEQSPDHMDSCSQGFGEGIGGQKEHFPTGIQNVAKGTLEEPYKSSRAHCEIKKTWGFRQSTVTKREMPVEAATNATENRYPVRRSGRQAKRTDKLEEFLLTAKRGSRKSAPPSLEIGDPSSQTPTDAETASEASFDGNADAKAVEDKAESPERRTRSSTRKQTPQKTGGRQTRSSGRLSVKDDGSSDNEEVGRDAAIEDQPVEENVEKVHADLGSTEMELPLPELDSVKTGDEQKSEQGDENLENEIDTAKETEMDNVDKPLAVLMKRGPIRTYVNKTKLTNNTTPVKAPAKEINSPVKRKIKLKATQDTGKTLKPQTGEENDDEDEDDDDDEEDDDSDSMSSSSSFDSDDGGYDPNALYCICRQKHNKRFMICCDRCEEWFHGDCVGITEARGRLMERNGEDYICPNCTAKKNQVVRPATSILSTNTEMGMLKSNVDPLTSGPAGTAEKTNTGAVDPSQSATQAVAVPQSPTLTGNGGKVVEDLGIKGRIEKATNPTGKKKIKIFQPQAMQQQKTAPTVAKTSGLTAEQKTPTDAEHKVASNVEVKTTPAAEVPEVKVGQKAADESSLPKCIGPGCENNAQPDSVYCCNDCILRHAAAAMKTITDVKDSKQKEKAKPQKNKSTPKRSCVSGKKMQKIPCEESDSEEDHSPDPDEDDEDKHAVEQRPPPTTASWSSDHNYIAVTPEKTTPISPTVLIKKCMYLFEGPHLLLKPHCSFSFISVP